MSLFEAVGASGFTAASHLFAGIIALVLLGFEVPRKVAGRPRGSVGPRSYIWGFVRIVSQCAPELLAIGFCLTTAVMLRVRGDMDENFESETEAQIWEEIKQDWPILCGADTLLNFQAWLRLALLTFVADKADKDLPLRGLASVFFFCAILARSILSTQTSAYRLDGPLALGGDLPIAVELAMLPRLAKLSFQRAVSKPKSTALLVSVASVFAARHFLNLAECTALDRLFSIAHVLETCSAVCYLYNTVITCIVRAESHSHSRGFIHLIMPVQAGLSAYYFVFAFVTHPKFIGGGDPFLVLVGCNLLQFGVFLCASCLFIASRFGKEVTSGKIEAPGVHVILEEGITMCP
jgi:hypothetical protein